MIADRQATDDYPRHTAELISRMLAASNAMEDKGQQIRDVPLTWLELDTISRALILHLADYQGIGNDKAA